MPTASDLINRALYKVGIASIGDSIDSADAESAKDSLNDMLEQWSLEDLMIYYTQIESLSLVAGTSSYTLGPTGTLVTVRPIEIISAQLRDTGGLDSDLGVVSFDTYQREIQKATNQTLPSLVSYQPTNPDGTLYIWPTPSSGLTCRLQTAKQFSTVTNLDDSVTLPIGYSEAIVYNLAERLCIDSGRKDLLEGIMEIASKSKLNIKRKNDKKNIMSFDPMFLPQRNSRYNVYTDQ